jgi:hypothetical protein
MTRFTATIELDADQEELLTQTAIFMDLEPQRFLDAALQSGIAHAEDICRAELDRAYAEGSHLDKRASAAEAAAIALSHEETLTAEIELNCALRTAFAAALKLYGCVRCAEMEIGCRLDGHAYAAKQWIMGQQPADPTTPIPTRRDGIAMRCSTPGCGEAPDFILANDLNDPIPF